MFGIVGANDGCQLKVDMRFEWSIEAMMVVRNMETKIQIRIQIDTQKYKQKAVN